MEDFNDIIYKQYDESQSLKAQQESASPKCGEDESKVSKITKDENQIDFIKEGIEE